MAGLVLPTAMLEAVLEHFVAVGQGTTKKLKLSKFEKQLENGSGARPVFIIMPF